MRHRVTFVASLALAVVAGTLASAPGSAAPSRADQPAAARATAGADAFVRSHAAALGTGANESLVRRAVLAGTRGLQYVAYDRTYRGLPVVGGDTVVVTDATGAVLSTSVGQQAAITVGTTPTVTAAAAARTARGQLSVVTGASTPRLVVLAWDTPRLAWEVVVDGHTPQAPSRLHVFVDATTGAIANAYDEVREGTGNGFYDGQVTITTSGSGSSFSMTDATRPGLRCGGQNGATFAGTDDVWGNGSGTNLETGCVDALYAAQKEYDMLRSWFGRNGFTGSGGAPPVRVGLNQANAFWNGSFASFGHSQDNLRQATPIDVVAHELGHALFQFTPGGAGGGNENGGINESTGDIFGALTEGFANNANDPPDYTVGEEVNLVGRGPIRFMYQPSLIAGHPNCYSSSIPSTEVHAAAGPLNHWFYLVAEGSAASGKPASPICAGGPSSVTGIGLRKAGEVYYNALLRKTSSWRYATVRLNSLQAAVQLYGAGSAECATVKAAWNAIAVPAQSGEPAC